MKLTYCDGKEKVFDLNPQTNRAKEVEPRLVQLKTSIRHQRIGESFRSGSTFS